MPARIRWAVDFLAPTPAARLLEIGYGPGVAAELVCPLLSDGSLTAIDRSAVAVRRCAERNAKQIAAGRLRVLQTDLAGLVLPAGSVDLAFAVEVNVFWSGDARTSLQVVRELLVVGGELSLIYGNAGPTQPPKVVGPITEALAAAGGFTVPEVFLGADGFALRSERSP